MTDAPAQKTSRAPLLIGGILLACLILFIINIVMSNASDNTTAVPAALQCNSEIDEIDGFPDVTGFGVSYTSNVTIRVTNSDGNTISATDSQMTETTGGLFLHTKTFYDIPEGSYRVAAFDGTERLVSSTMLAKQGESKVLVIVCQ